MTSSATRQAGALTARLHIASSVALTALTVLMLAAYFPLVADDAYIVARYAQQLYAGHGLVFNPGERINAVTSPLLTLVVALLYPLARDPVTVYRIAASVVVAWTLVALARRAYRATHDRLLFLALTLASPFVAFWAIGGLETPLLLSACSWLTWLALSASPGHDGRRAAQIIALATVAVLARYDAALYVAPVAALYLWRYRGDRRAVFVAMACVAVVAGWIGFTYAYYGDIFPTSFYVKLAGDEPFGGVVRGAGYAVSFGVLALVIPLAAFRPWRGAPLSDERRTAVAMLGAGVLLELGYAIFAGDTHMMYAYRLFVPYLPSLVLLLLRADETRNAGTAAGRTQAGLALALLGWQALLGAFLYYGSENPNLSLLFRKQEIGNESYEFSTIGARYTKPFLAAVRASASEIDAHWKTVAQSKSRPLRIAALTGGMLPYHLPEAYVLETLASYRRRCTVELTAAADYAQVVQNADAPSPPAKLFGSDDGAWQLISKHEMTVNGWQNKPFRLRVDIWYHALPAPLILPSTVGEPCRSAT